MATLTWGELKKRVEAIESVTDDMPIYHIELIEPHTDDRLEIDTDGQALMITRIP